MSKYLYYLYDNYTNEQIENSFDNPRNFLYDKADDILLTVLNSEVGSCTYKQLCKAHTKEFVDGLINIGLFRAEKNALYLDSAVIVEKDFEILNSYTKEYRNIFADIIEKHKDKFYEIAKKLNNGFEPKINLYHILCGAVLDGLFIDCLSKNKILSTSKIHRSNLDYLIIIYENSDRLNKFSRKLLCSYNRFVDGEHAFQSFGDTDGIRRDFYRFSVKYSQNKIEEDLIEIAEIWNEFDLDKNRKIIFEELKKFIKTNACDKDFLRLFTEFGYIKNEKLAVPIYYKNDIEIIDEIGKLIETILYEAMADALTSVSKNSDLICSKHGVNPKEIANELYHILFGGLNEELVERGFVHKPEYHPLQGRYLKSIQLF